MKKPFIILTIILCAAAPLFADDYTAMMMSARSQSAELENAEMQHENSLMGKSGKTEEKKTEVTVRGTVTPISQRDLSSDSFNISQLSADIVLPNEGRTTIRLKSPMEIAYDGGYTIHPGISVNHSFDLTEKRADDDYVADLNDAISVIESERSLARSKMNYDKSVINAMKGLLSSEKSIRQQEHQIANSERSLRESMELGKLTEGSIEWQKTERNIDQSRDRLEKQKRQYEEQKRKFSSLTGLEWNGVESIPSYDLEVVALPSGNSDVEIASMRLEIARHQRDTYGIPEPERRSINIDGGVNGTIRNGIASSPAVPGGTPLQDRMSVNMSLEYANPTWNIKGTLDVAGTSLDTIAPTVTVTGSWSSAPKSRKGEAASSLSRTEEEEKRKLDNEVRRLEIALADAERRYAEETRALEAEIRDHEWSMIDYESNVEFLRSELEFEQALFDEGLSTERSVDEARFSLEMALLDESSVRLDGVLIAYEIADHAL